MNPEIFEMKGLKAELRQESKKLRLNFNELKSGGFIKQTQKDLFTVRLRCPGGKVTSQQMQKAAEIAEKYGNGEVHISVRQSIEVPYVSYRHFDAIAQSLREINWSVASCGARIRVPTACAGCAYNPNGLTDTQSVCAEVDRRYFGTPTGHHKFKISFSGCPIDCFRTREMDLGFQGVMEPNLMKDLCTSCGLCVKGCEENALKMENGLPVRDDSKCISCGDCVKVCPSSAMISKRTGWLARVGGKHGKHPYNAYEVANFLTDDQVHLLIEKTISWYQEKGTGRERIGVTIERIGLDRYIEDVVVPLGLEAIRTQQQRNKYYSCGNSGSTGGASISAEDEEPVLESSPVVDSDHSLDLRGVLCPINFVKIKLALEELAPGNSLNVILDDGEPMRNVPRSVKEEGHRITGVEKLSDDSYKLAIQKGS